MGCHIGTLRPVNTIAEPPQVMAQMSPHHAETHWRPESMRLGAGGRCSGGLDRFNTKEVPAGSKLGAAWVGEVGAPPELGKPCTPFGLEGFEEFGAVLGGMSTFGDLPLARSLFVEGSGLMSWGTLYRGS
jgi:hypothetical protein